MAIWAEDLGLARLADVKGMTVRLRETGTEPTGKGVQARAVDGSYAVFLQGRETARLADPRKAIETGLLTWLLARHGGHAEIDAIHEVLSVLSYSEALEALRRKGPRVFAP